MVFEQVFSEKGIILNLESRDKDELFEEMVESIVALQPGIEREQALAALHEREEKMSTGIMHAIAVPHCHCDLAKGEVGVVGISRSGIDYQALDNAPVNLVFMLVCNPDETELHLKVLKELAAVLQNPAFMGEVMAAKTSKEVYDLLLSYEASL